MKNDFSLESLFGDQDIDVDCPACNHNFMVKFSIVLNDKSVIVCPKCKTDIVLKHDDETKKNITDSSKALDEFNDALSNLGKTMKKFGK